MSKCVFSLLLFPLFLLKIHGQVVSNAGANQTICYNSTTSIGGSPSASGGSPPYTYDWQPITFLASGNVSNPIAINCTEDVTYTLTVTDTDGNTSTSSIKININKIRTFNAGVDTGYCYGQTNGIQLGAPSNDNSLHTFSWSPPFGLDNPSAPRPICTTSAITVYQLTVSDGLCPNHVSQVTVVPFLAPRVDAGLDTTIDEGSIITLRGIGNTTYDWSPDYNIKYASTPNPEVWPVVTTVYTLSTKDSHQCYGSDTVKVTVIRGDKLFFYSAFTPNHDGDNDVFFIGNVEKYPDNNLKIYNRYGNLIYSATNYANTWDGTYLGNNVPTGTYFYIFDDGKEKKYQGALTILR